MSVFLDVVSFLKSQTQTGLSAISMKKNKVTSAAIRYFVANTKQQFTKPDNTPPNKKQRSKSWTEICNDPILRKNDTIIAIKPDSNKHGSISVSFFNLKIIVKIENKMAVKSANMFPVKSPIWKAP